MHSNETTTAIKRSVRWGRCRIYIPQRHMIIPYKCSGRRDAEPFGTPRALFLAITLKKQVCHPGATDMFQYDGHTAWACTAGNSVLHTFHDRLRLPHPQLAWQTVLNPIGTLTMPHSVPQGLLQPSPSLLMPTEWTSVPHSGHRNAVRKRCPAL
eukprot:8816180-Pyramimonas_sp.AAC.1